MSLLRIPTAAQRVMLSLEERRTADAAQRETNDPDVITFDDVPSENGVIDAGVGSGEPVAAGPEVVGEPINPDATPDAEPATINGEPATAAVTTDVVVSADNVPDTDPVGDTAEPAPVIVPEDPIAAPADGDAVVEDPAVPAVGDDTQPAEAVISETTELPEPDNGEETPVEAAAPTDVVDVVAEPAVDAPVAPPVPDDAVPATVAGDADVTPPPVVEESTPGTEGDAVTDTGLDDASGADVAPVTDVTATNTAPVTTDEPVSLDTSSEEPPTDNPVDVPVSPVEDTPAPMEDTPSPAIEPAVVEPEVTESTVDQSAPAGESPVPDTEPAASIDASADIDPPVTGEAPVVEAPLEDIPAESTPPMENLTAGNPEGEPEVAAPVDAATAPTDVVSDVSGDGIVVTDAAEMATGTPPEEMTSAWVDGVAVDVEEASRIVADAAAEIEGTDIALEELMDAAFSLEELHAVVSDNLAEENPILSEATLNLTKIHGDNVLRRVVSEVKNIPSLEEAGSLQAMTRLTLEALSENIQRVWEMVQSAMDAAVAALKNYVTAMVDVVERNRQSITSIKDQLTKLDDSAVPTNTVIDAGDIIGVGGVGELNQQVTTLSGKLESYFTESPSATQALLQKLRDLIPGVVAADTDYTADMSKEISGVVDVFMGVVGKVVMGSGEGTQATADVLPGGYVITLNGSDLSSGGTVVTLTQVDSERTESLEVATVPQLRELIQTLEGLSDLVLKHREDYSQVNGDVESLMNDVKLNISSGAADNDGSTHLTSNIQSLVNVVISVQRINQTIYQYTTILTSNVLMYVVSCLKQYTTKSEGE